MSEAHLNALQLSAERIITMTDFYESYANLVRRREEANSDSQAAALETASALRSAGQWAMVLDLGRAVELLVESAQIWDQLGHGFGTYVLAALRPGELRQQIRSLRRDQLIQALIGRRDDTHFDRERRPPSRNEGAEAEWADAEIASPLLHPQQQAYLLLALAGDAESVQIQGFAERSAHRLGVVPIGALGMPLRIYWDIAMHLMSGEDTGLEVIAGHLESMAASYATAINSAMANEHLWFNAASPVDVGDIDIVAIGALAARRFGTDSLRAAILRRAERHDPVTRVPLELAVEMAEYVTG
ncbi:hypothetical protein [Actinoplanes derwentensis]|uniref:Uncharacterized protein n=1 Tax=Actinoplanes derwentensis TaxID=113562 RepID=A0A1H1RXN6_9ACTN|nr:hypothetical protein [Actinoplanes derwentensis]GID84549.1 hypothetical protein Ade03nite_34730 [Actinoplanes derwentensis]SDS40470.1 hypothetical protein SAMN04489716_0712 [Actinoplanes derwentensis]